MMLQQLSDDTWRPETWRAPSLGAALAVLGVVFAALVLFGA